MTRTVVLVTGPPCAGKSTYVAQRAQPGDLILDQDQLGPRTMGRRLRTVATMTTGTAWVIRCQPDPRQRARLANRIRATHHVHLHPGPQTLLARARTRPHPERHLAAIRDWLDREAHARRAVTAIQRTTTEQGLGWEHQQARAKALPKAWGQPCPYCGQPMLQGQDLDLDHAQPRALGGHHGPRRMAHAHCNRAAGSRLGAQLRRARRATTTQRHSRRW
ncbi:hypothetical protein GA0070616_4376 [Micromonospora nigra]|uniref:HNH domain-containing protein n=1 Tax=Micromonospora nigra TaxID=145857 RepID=A0A1C6SRQ6_9ACTN|nr:HNH endonuclease [Micromonospora nigra]SCL32029.1 hypothetical protein GA0070616_4376 [Micromonospora nigra]